jgi:hypothetical protein
MDFNNKLKPVAKKYTPQSQGEQSVFNILKPLLTQQDGRLGVRALKPNERRPNNFRFLAGNTSGTSGMVEFQGQKYNYEMIGDQLVIVPESDMNSKYNNNSSLLMEDYNWGKGE